MASPEASVESGKEMLLVEQCLQKNHKSYAAWHQRQWLVEQGHVDKGKDLKAVERYGTSVSHLWQTGDDDLKAVL